MLLTLVSVLLQKALLFARVFVVAKQIMLQIHHKNHKLCTEKKENATMHA